MSITFRKSYDHVTTLIGSLCPPQWTNTGLDPQFSKFNGQEWTETYEGWGMVRNAPEIKSRERSGNVPKKKKKGKERKEEK